MTSAREEVLARLRGALGDAPAPPAVPRDYRLSGSHGPGTAELVAAFVDRLEDYRAVVVRTSADDSSIGHAVAESLSHKGIRDVIVPPGVPRQWTPAQLGVTVDTGAATPRELDDVAAVVTGSVVAIAETGTIVLDGGALCGRRAITLVPDTHVCVVSAADIVETVPEGLRRLDPTRPLTLVSGPSATSDIELDRVEGVHGPRTLIVVIAG